MAPNSPWIGIDFGTSNSAVAYLDEGIPRLVQFDAASTLPTTFFFDFDAKQTLIGEAANQALLDGQEGRFMRALKRVLGTSLMHEKRQILNERLTFVEIIGSFLKRLKERAETERGCACTRVISGRPVVFHGFDKAREARAEADLRQCYEFAGFTDIQFCPEPAAAAIATGNTDQGNSTGLVVDIGGGTSDFSVFRNGPSGIEILANHGVRIGGTDFDRAISIDRVMPLLGKGSMIKDVFGDGMSQTPIAIYNDLATWEMIPFLYTAKNQRMVDEMLALAQSPDRLKRLATVLEYELGHELAFAVERGKIAVNSSAHDPSIRLDVLETGLNVPLSPALVTESLSAHAKSLQAGAQDVLDQAGLTSEQIDRVVYVGGSSLMGVVSDTMRGVFPTADHSFASVFTAVAEGLAIVAAQQDS